MCAAELTATHHSCRLKSEQGSALQSHKNTPSWFSNTSSEKEWGRQKGPDPQTPPNLLTE